MYSRYCGTGAIPGTHSESADSLHQLRCLPVLRMTDSSAKIFTRDRLLTLTSPFRRKPLFSCIVLSVDCS